MLVFIGCSDKDSFRLDGGGPDLPRADLFLYKLDRGSIPVPETGLPDLPVVDRSLTKEGGLPDGPSDIGGKKEQGTTVKVAPFTENFDTHNGGLVGNKDWEWSTSYAFKPSSACDGTQVPPSKPKSGTGMWGTKLNDCYTARGNNSTSNGTTCTNTVPSDDSILSFKVSIPSTFTHSSLEFYEWLDINYYFDWNEIRVDDGTTVKVVEQYCKSGYTKPTAWTSQWVDLDPYIGKTVTISFHFMASSISNMAGWYIDDLEVNNQ